METKDYSQIFELQNKYVMNTYVSTGLMLVRGKGVNVWDSNGKSYIDFACGISVSNLGHCHPAVTNAVKKQLSTLVHVSNLFYNEYQPRLAEKLIRHGFDGQAFFCNSGAEANEGLIKFARKWGFESGRHEIIVMEESFHGRTLATLAATGREKYRHGFQPDMPGFVHVPFNDLEAVKKAYNSKTVAILLEPVQGEGGIIASNAEYLRKIREFCDEKNILLLFDEVQCGMGRTGFFYAYQGYGIEPDGLSLAKALGNGIPIGAFLVKRKYEKVLTPGTHASTFGGTPLACAGALAVIDTIHNENLLANCVKQGHFLVEQLEKLKKKYPCMLEVRGKGLLAGVLFDDSVKVGAKLLPLLREHGLIALPAGENVLRLLPPLNVKEREIKAAVKIIAECLAVLAAAKQAST